MRNTQRQPALSAPASRRGTARAAPAMPPSPDQAPIARARSSGRNAGLQDRQAARRQQRAADALHRAGGHQRLDVRREPAGQGRHGEPDGADDEDPPAAEAVAQRAAEQDQRGEGQRVGVDRPLQPGHAGVQVLADLGQRDVHDRGVDEGQPRPEHRGGQHPPGPRLAERQPGRRGGRRGGVGHGREASLLAVVERSGLLRHPAADQARHQAGQPGSPDGCTGAVRGGHPRPAAGCRAAPAGRPLGVRRGAGLCARRHVHCSNGSGRRGTG